MKKMRAVTKGSMRGTGSVPKNKFRNTPQRSKRR